MLTVEIGLRHGFKDAITHQSLSPTVRLVARSANCDRVMSLVTRCGREPLNGRGNATDTPEGAVPSYRYKGGFLKVLFFCAISFLTDRILSRIMGDRILI
jgi:hypothetical protein